MTNGNKTTVPDRIRALGLEQGTARGNELAWRSGAAVREEWLEAVGEYPPKGNRPKTSGHGSHCFALYPVAWIERIDATVCRIAAELDAEDAAQLALFGGDR
jgi:hypothetical protein